MKNSLVGGLKTFATFILGLYFISFNFMLFYYWWADVKAHDSFVRAVTIAPLVGTFKGAVWPYFAFVHGKYVFVPEYAEMDAKTEMTIKGFFAGSKYFADAKKLAYNSLDSKKVESDVATIIYLLIKSKERLSECDVETLNTIYPEWGDLVRDKLIPFVDLEIASFDPMGDGDVFERAKTLDAEIDTWLLANWDGITLSLNSK